MELSTKALFAAELKELPKVITWARAYLLQIVSDATLIKKMELVLEEAFVNIVHHAYQGKGGIVEILFQGKAKSHLEIVFTDKGISFNPTEKIREFDPSIPLEKRKEGGLGIYLMRQMVDEMLYRRDGVCNVLTFRKKLH